MSKLRSTITEFAQTCADILKTDRYIMIVCDGEMGEGKSCFTSQLARKVAQITKTPFNYQDNITFLRSELKTWVDGDDKGENKKPEYSSVLADELISMFFKRNWYDSDQIDGIELLNKCRDRHLFVCGNIPNFWDLDSAIYPLITFWVHIHERGLAWVSMKDRNPYITDKWHRLENSKSFSKFGVPYKCRGFICEIKFDDWNDADREEYYNVRNTKRVNTEGQRTEKISRRGKRAVEQRNSLIRFMIQEGYKAKVISKTIQPRLDEGEISRIVAEL